MSSETRRADMKASILLVGGVVLLAMTGLGMDGNWPKVARVVTAFLTYVVVLFAVRGARDGGEDVPFRDFAVAGGSCGLVSGLVREEVQTAVVAAGILAGSLLLGGLHWLVLRSWRRLHSMAIR